METAEQIIERLRRENYNLRLACVEEIEREQQKHRWQPIETAPKDGTHVLVYQPAEDDIFPPITTAHWIGDWSVSVVYYHEGVWKPTHWMPLPPAPHG